MRATVILCSDGVLVMKFSGVTENDRGRMANIEISLLRELGHYQSDPWQWAVAPGERKALVVLKRPYSNRNDYETAQSILRGFCFEV